MMDVLYLQARVLALDETAVGRAAFVQGMVGDGRERWLQCRESFSRGLRTRKLFLSEGYAAVEIQDGDQTAIEKTALDGAAGAPLAFQGQGVDVGTTDVFQGRNGVGAHTLVRLRVKRAQTLVAPVHQWRTGMREIGRVRHHLRAPGDHQVL